jgi:hypothetical protein
MSDWKGEGGKETYTKMRIDFGEVNEEFLVNLCVFCDYLGHFGCASIPLYGAGLF